MILVKFHCQESDTEIFFDGAVDRGSVQVFNSFVIRIISVENLLKLDNLANLMTRKLKLLITVIDQNGVQSCSLT